MLGTLAMFVLTVIVIVGVISPYSPAHAQPPDTFSVTDKYYKVQQEAATQWQSDIQPCQQIRDSGRRNPDRMAVEAAAQQCEQNARDRYQQTLRQLSAKLWTFITTSPYDNGVNDVLVGFLEGLLHVDKSGSPGGRRIQLGKDLSQIRNNLNYHRGYLAGAIVNVGADFVRIRTKSRPEPRTASPARPMPEPVELTLLKPNQRYWDNRTGYEFLTDELGRPVDIKAGNLLLGKGVRNPRQQTLAGGSSRLPTDEGGHLLGTQFMGPENLVNVLAQDKTLNRGAGSMWKKMENLWANALKQGKRVSVRIKPIYEGDSWRPSEFQVDYSIDGKSFHQLFLNAAPSSSYRLPPSSESWKAA